MIESLNNLISILGQVTGMPVKFFFLSILLAIAVIILIAAFKFTRCLFSAAHIIVQAAEALSELLVELSLRYQQRQQSQPDTKENQPSPPYDTYYVSITTPDGSRQATFFYHGPPPTSTTEEEEEKERNEPVQ